MSAKGCEIVPLLCQNCSGPLRFDPDEGKLVCSLCAGRFDVTHTEGASLVDLDSMYKDVSAPKRDEIRVYSCSTCGGHIVVHGVEITSTCPYCGNFGVVFDRIEKKRRPDVIIPFSFGKEKAEEKLRTHLMQSLFLSKKAKNMEWISIQAIYIPYYLVSAELKRILTLEHIDRDRHGREIDRQHIARSVRCLFNKLSLEASSALLNEASHVIEPFDFSGLQVFEEGYLQGFASDMADEDAKSLCDTASEMCRSYVSEEIKKKKVIPRGFHICGSEESLKFRGKALYALFPVWFAVGKYGKKTVTLLVNGQTGKVGGAPAYSWVKYHTTLFLISLITMALMCAVGILGIYLLYLFTTTGLIYPASGIVVGLGFLFSVLVRLVTKKREMIREVISVSKSKELINFAKREER